MPDFGIGSMGAAGISGMMNMIGAAQQFQYNKELQSNAENYNSSQVQAQENYQTQMSNTEYQRGTADMQAAGINPMLAYMKGGASSPSGSSASAPPSPQAPNLLNSGVSSALDTLRFSQEQKNSRADLDNKVAQGVVLGHGAKAAEANARTAQANAEAAEYSVDSKEAQADLDEASAKAGLKYVDANALTGGGAGTLSVANRVRNLIGTAAKNAPTFPGWDNRSSDRVFQQMLENAGSAGIAVPTPNDE